jgi:large subunit ribosomal protein L17
MSHRKALLRNLANSFIEAGKMETTLTKAKYVKPYIEKAVTKARRGTDFTNIKSVSKLLTTDIAAKKLFNEIAPKYASRPGGYTKIIKLPNRVGDNTPMARIEWVEEKKVTKEPKAKPVKKKKVETND